jgi:PAS domain S-box-containing protein
MDYKLSDLIDVEKSRALLESFCEAVGIASAIIDLEGNVLIGVRWQRICTDFHRVNESACKRCIESDTELANKLSMGKKFSLYRCKNGMTDAASPIIIEGQHIANAFVGQFLLHPPDIEDFRRQAAKFGFNEQDYLNALNEVAIIPEKKVAPIMDFLTSYAETLANMGLDKIRTKHYQKELLHHRENLEEMVKKRTAELRKLSEAVEQSPVTVMITDKMGTIEYVNPSFSEVTGYSAKEAIGQNPRILKSGNHPDSFYKGLWDTILSGRTWRGEILNRKKNDEEFWESASISAIKNDEGDITHFVAVKQGITDQKRAEQAIMESQAKYRNLVEYANCIIFQMDPQGKITFFNRFAQDFFGYSEAEILGRSVVGTIAPATDSSGRNLEIMIQDIVKHPERYTDNENENIRRNGELVWVAWTNRAIYDDENRLSEILCIGIDRTEQKRAEEIVKNSEQRLAQIINFLPDPTWVIDSEGKVLTWNRAMENLTGIAAADIVGKGNYEYALPFYGERRPILIDLVRDWNAEYEKKYLSIKKEGNTLVSESHHPHLGDGGLYLSGNASLIYDAAGQVAGAIESLRDISERRHMEENLRRNVEELELFNKLATGRELKMIQLKQEINELLGRLGQGEKYEIVE